MRGARPPAPGKGGGVLLDLGSHLVDQALQLFGPASHVYAEIDNRRASAGDDDAFLALRHRSGAYSHLWMSALAAAPGPRLRVLGTRAAYVVAEVDGQEDALRSGRRPDDPDTWGIEPRVALGPARARARRARRFRASRARGRPSTQSSSARCARAGRRPSIRPTRSPRSR